MEAGSPASGQGRGGECPRASSRAVSSSPESQASFLSGDSALVMLWRRSRRKDVPGRTEAMPQRLDHLMQSADSQVCWVLGVLRQQWCVVTQQMVMAHHSVGWAGSEIWRQSLAPVSYLSSWDVPGAWATGGGCRCLNLCLRRRCSESVCGCFEFKNDWV